MMYGIYNGWSWGNMMGWFGGGIIMVLFWGAVIYFITWLVRNNKVNETDSRKAPYHTQGQEPFVFFHLLFLYCHSYIF